MLRELYGALSPGAIAGMTTCVRGEPESGVQAKFPGVEPGGLNCSHRSLEQTNGYVTNSTLKQLSRSLPEPYAPISQLGPGHFGDRIVSRL